MPDPGDVVTVDFTGAAGVKRRPAVVVSSLLYRMLDNYVVNPLREKPHASECSCNVRALWTLDD